MKRIPTVLLITLAASLGAKADFLQLTTVTPGTAGTFTGTLGTVSVTGAITTPAPTNGFVFEGTAGPSLYESSVLNDTSPQYSDSSIYTPSIGLTDQVGYTSFNGTDNVATVTINFSAPVRDPIFEVANIDGTQLNFAPTTGLQGLLLLSGNGGGGDGIQVVGDVISDANPSTEVGQSPSSPPLTIGARSAYGSVEIYGTFTSLVFIDSNPTGIGDGGSFTIAETPEPSTAALAFGSMFLLLIIGARRRVHQSRRANYWFK